MASKAFLTLQNEGMALLEDVPRLHNCNMNETRSKLAEAKKLFDQELAMSSSSYERAYGCQNLGVLHLKCGMLELDSLPSWESISHQKLAAVTDHLAQSVAFFLKAKAEEGRANVTWKLMNMQDCLLYVVNWIVDQAKKIPLLDAPSVLRRLCVEFDYFDKFYGKNLSCEAAVVARLELAQYLLQDPTFQTLDHRAEEECFRLLERVEQIEGNLSPKQMTTVSTLRKQVESKAVVAYFELASSMVERAQLDSEDVKYRARGVRLLQEAERLLTKLPKTERPMPRDKISTLQFKIGKKPVQSLFARFTI